MTAVTRNARDLEPPKWCYQLPIESCALFFVETEQIRLPCAVNGHTCRPGEPRVVHLHIPKAAGFTWNRLLKDVFGNVGGGERCFEAVYEGRAKGVTHTALFRSPRTHVLSQYVMCSFSDWGQTATHGRRLPRPASTSAADIGDGFRRWVGFFGSQWQPQDGHFNCYNPRSMQARALTCEGSTAAAQHGASQRRLPPLPDAVANMHRLEHVGLIELLPESWVYYAAAPGP